MRFILAQFCSTVFLATAILSFAGTQDGQPTARKSGIEIETVLGPLTPPQSSQQLDVVQPYSATLRIVSVEPRFEIEVTTDAQGRYRSELPPGQYTIAPKKSGFGPPRPPRPQNLTVQTGTFTKIRLVYDSGVR